MITIEVVTSTTQIGWKCSLDTEHDTKRIPYALMPDFFEKMGRVDGLLRSLGRYSFEGEISVCVTREDCSITGKIKTNYTDLKKALDPIVQQIEGIAKIINGIVDSSTWFQLVWVYKREWVE